MLSVGGGKDGLTNRLWVGGGSMSPDKVGEVGEEEEVEKEEEDNDNDNSYNNKQKQKHLL